MRKLTLITILILLVGGLQAQDKATIPGNNNWRTELASIFTGDSDLSGTSIYSEYYKYVGKRIKLAVGIGGQNFSSTHKGEFKSGDVWFNNADALMAGISCYYDVFKTKKVNFELGFGCFIKKWDVTNVIFRMYPDMSSGDVKWIADEIVDSSKKNTSFTLSISLGSQLYISDKISVNLRGFYQQGVENNSKPVLGIAAGLIVKWNND